MSNSAIPAFPPAAKPFEIPPDPNMPPPVVAKPPASPPRLRVLPNNMKRLDQVCQQFFVWVEDGHTYEDILQPDYWSHVGRRMTSNAMITARAMDGSWTALLYVIQNGDSWAKVQEIWHVKTKKVIVVSDRDLYRIDHVPAQGWRVIHLETKKVMVSSLKARDMAEKFVTEVIEAKTS